MQRRKNQLFNNEKIKAMKKTLLLVVAVLFGIALNAQIPVWDGTTEKWTHGSGTPEDPYLIENAQNLAYLAEQVNLPTIHTPYVYEMFSDTCFLLTTDLDLGGANGLLWTPIGKCDCRNNYHAAKTAFSGNFDGGGHTIYNMHIGPYMDLSNMSFGLFGMACNGCIKNIIMASNCKIDIEGDYYTAHVLYAGGVLGQGGGDKMVLEDCVNRCSVRADFCKLEGACCGGLFGNIAGATIRNCHNYGDVYCRGSVTYYGLCPAGIASYAERCDIYGCTNRGNITGILCGEFSFAERDALGGIVGIARGDCNVEQCGNMGNLLYKDENGYNEAMSCGGIVGGTYELAYSTNLFIKNCYNVADISVICVLEDIKYNYAGGIFGASFGYWQDPANYSLTIENCYAAGVIAADTVGGVLAHEGWIVYELPKQASVINSYYLNTIESMNEYGMSLSEELMKSEEFVNMLNTDGVVFMMDVNNENNGYPLFANKSPLNVNENNASDGVSVYPNPANDIINISSENESCKAVEVYSVDGRLVKSQYDNLKTINISDLNTGVYIMKIRMSDGTEVAKRVMKE